MKISENQITELYKFTRQHFVEYYDVQTELVDHLANDIEQIWETEPSLSFTDARGRSFKKFGVFGFMDVVEQKQKAMNKRYLKILWRFVKEWFSLPKVVITSIIFILFSFFFQIEPAGIILIIAIMTLAVFELIVGVITKYKLNIKKKRNENVFLLEEMIHKTKSGLILMLVINVLNFIKILKVDFSLISIYWVYLSSFLATFFLIIYYIITFVMPSKAEELLVETYPEYKMS